MPARKLAHLRTEDPWESGATSLFVLDLTTSLAAMLLARRADLLEWQKTRKDLDGLVCRCEFENSVSYGYHEEFFDAVHSAARIEDAHTGFTRWRDISRLAVPSDLEYEGSYPDLLVDKDGVTVQTTCISPGPVPWWLIEDIVTAPRRPFERHH